MGAAEVEANAGGGVGAAVPKAADELEYLLALAVDIASAKPDDDADDVNELDFLSAAAVSLADLNASAAAAPLKATKPPALMKLLLLLLKYDVAGEVIFRYVCEPELGANCALRERGLLIKLPAIEG